MKMIYGDFESYYDKEYTLKKMTPYEYILDPRWETIGCGIGVDNAPITFFEGDAVADFLRVYPRPWAFVSYNALFDASILSFRYNIHPDMLIDAMGIVRAVLLHKIRNGRVSLANVCDVLGLPTKDGNALIPGYRRVDYIRDGKMQRLIDYCINDTERVRDIIKLLGRQFPRRQLWVMNTILKMCTRPHFYADLNLLHSHLNEILENKASLLSRVGLSRADLLSADKFAEALQLKGVEPPTKPSLAAAAKGEHKLIWAFSKTDEAFRELEEHEDPDVQALVAARLGIKSTMEERRSQRFIAMASAAQNAFGAPWMPVALRYGAAHTHRFGGEWSVNMQNLPSRKSKKLRESLVAPPGYKVVSVDASQIEARLTAWLAGEFDLLEQFALGADVYCWFGSDLFKRIITKADKIERFCSKEIVLGLGFQMGVNTLLRNLISKATEYGFDIEFKLAQCEVWVQFYRRKFKRIQSMWYEYDSMLRKIINYPRSKFNVGPSVMDGTDLILPTELRLYYDNLRERDGELVFDYARETKKIYGGKFTENHVQALDTAHVMDAAERISARCHDVNLPQESYALAHQVHDELIYVVPDGLVNTLGVIAYEEMKTPAFWEGTSA